MPDPRNRLKWNATVKAYPAIGDLQAVIDNYGNVGYKASADCTGSYHLSLSAVPDGELWVVTNISMVNNDSICDILFQANINGIAYPLRRYYDIAANTVIFWTGNIVLNKDDYIKGGYYGGGATDELVMWGVGYKIGAY